jgi:hypothetical protein
VEGVRLLTVASKARPYILYFQFPLSKKILTSKKPFKIEDLGS